jgi:hypothetical protein
MYTLEVYALMIGVVFTLFFLLALLIVAFKSARDCERARRAILRRVPAVFPETNGRAY